MKVESIGGVSSSDCEVEVETTCARLFEME